MYSRAMLSSSFILMPCNHSLFMKICMTIKNPYHTSCMLPISKSINSETWQHWYVKHRQLQVNKLVACSNLTVIKSTVEGDNVKPTMLYRPSLFTYWVSMATNNWPIPCNPFSTSSCILPCKTQKGSRYLR